MDQGAGSRGSRGDTGDRGDPGTSKSLGVDFEDSRSGYDFIFKSFTLSADV